MSSEGSASRLRTLITALLVVIVGAFVLLRGVGVIPNGAALAFIILGWTGMFIAAIVRWLRS